MSATNWDVCPRCKRNAAQKLKYDQESVRLAYGKLPEAEYRDLAAEVAIRAQAPPNIITLREDYEVGIVEDTGEFYVRYKGHCDECGFNHRFEHDEATNV